LGCETAGAGVALFWGEWPFAKIVAVDVDDTITKTSMGRSLRVVKAYKRDVKPPTNSFEIRHCHCILQLSPP
jgi:hypothetical protein